MVDGEADTPVSAMRGVSRKAHATQSGRWMTALCTFQASSRSRTRPRDRPALGAGIRRPVEQADRSGVRSKVHLDFWSQHANESQALCSWMGCKKRSQNLSFGLVRPVLMSKKGLPTIMTPKNGSSTSKDSPRVQRGIAWLRLQASDTR